jgi:heme/copper-type cytochrome/quinol oxidase subunit 3
MYGELATFTIAVLRYGSIFFIATGFHGLAGMWNEVVSFKILL